MSLVENLLCEYYDPSFYIKEIIDAYMILIFTELLKNYHNDETTTPRFHNKAYIGEIIQHIAEDYNNCSLSSVADKVKLHPNDLSRYIKEQTGYKQLVQEQRVNKAGFLLLNTGLSIEDICLEIGYQNLDFFYKKFRDKFAMTPKNIVIIIKIATYFSKELDRYKLPKDIIMYRIKIGVVEYVFNERRM